MTTRPRARPQQALAEIVAALSSSHDVGQTLGEAAAAIAEAENASQVQIWGREGSGSLVCLAVWARREAGRVGAKRGDAAQAKTAARTATAGRTTAHRTHRDVQVGVVADLDTRPDLRAVLDGAEMLEWRAGDELPEAAKAVLEAHASARVLTLAVRVGDQAVGALTIAQSGPIAKLTAAEKKRLTLFAQIIAGAVHSAGVATAIDGTARQADALRAASRAVAGLVESDQAVEAVTRHVAALIGGRECRVRVFLRTDSDTYAEFPPRQEDERANVVKTERPDELERQVLAECRTLTVAAGGAVRLATPLLLRGAPLGYLTLISARSRPLTPGEIDDVETLAQQICLTLDIARLRRAVQRLTMMDTLTGLKSREFFFERMTAEIARARRYQEPLSLIIVDLDDFTGFNAAHGNREGNRLLRGTANLMKTCIRERIDVACRYSGERFALLLPNTPATAAGAGIVAERVRKAVEATHVHDDNDNRLRQVTVSLGVAGFPAHAEDAEDLVGMATEALRAAKAAGKNRVGLYSLNG